MSSRRPSACMRSHLQRVGCHKDSETQPLLSPGSIHPPRRPEACRRLLPNHARHPSVPPQSHRVHRQFGSDQGVLVGLHLQSTSLNPPAEVLVGLHLQGKSLHPQGAMMDLRSSRQPSRSRPQSGTGQCQPPISTRTGNIVWTTSGRCLATRCIWRDRPRQPGMRSSLLAIPT